MIITVTMNPAIDKTVEVDKFQPYVLNRIRRIEYDPAARELMFPNDHALGGKVLLWGSLEEIPARQSKMY